MESSFLEMSLLGNLCGRGKYTPDGARRYRELELVVRLPIDPGRVPRDDLVRLVERL